MHPEWTLAWWGWWHDLAWWQALFAALAITPFGLWVVRRLVQGFWVNPFTHDWMSFNCDVLIAGAVGAMVWLGYTMPPGSGITQGAWYDAVNYGSIAAWTAFAVFHMWQERHDVPVWRRRLGATSVYHFGVFVYFAPFATVLFINTLFAPWDTPSRVAVHLVPILAFAAWISVGMLYDPTHQKAPNGASKHDFTSPTDGWRNVRLFWRWLAR